MCLKRRILEQSWCYYYSYYFGISSSCADKRVYAYIQYGCRMENSEKDFIDKFLGPFVASKECDNLDLTVFL